MKYSTSLKLNHIFRRLYHSNGLADSYLVLYARKNRSETNRVGITVGKKLGHAVVRNRTRRRLREIYRLNEHRFQPGWDIVVVARTRAVEAPFQKLTASYLSLAAKAGILREEGNPQRNIFSLPSFAFIRNTFHRPFRRDAGFVPPVLPMPMRQFAATEPSGEAGWR